MLPVEANCKTNAAKNSSSAGIRGSANESVLCRNHKMECALCSVTNTLLCMLQRAPALTCIEGPPRPPYERQLTLVEDRVQDVGGIPVGVCPECWLPIGCLGTLHHVLALSRCALSLSPGALALSPSTLAISPSALALSPCARAVSMKTNRRHFVVLLLTYSGWRIVHQKGSLLKAMPCDAVASNCGLDELHAYVILPD